MNLPPFSLKISGKSCLPAFVFTLVLSVIILPLNAQSRLSSPSTQIAQSSETVELADEQEKAQQVLKLWQAKDFEQLRPYLSDDLQAVLPVDELKRFWQQQVEDIGRIKKINKPGQVVDAINANLVFIPVEFEKLTANVIVTFSEDGKIVGVNFPTRKTIQAIAQESVTALAKGDQIQARDHFSPELKAEISPQQMQQQWQERQKRTGAFQKIVKTEVISSSSMGATNLVLVTLEFEKLTDDMFFIFGQDKQIVGVDFPDGIAGN